MLDLAGDCLVVLAFGFASLAGSVGLYRLVRWLAGCDRRTRRKSVWSPTAYEQVVARVSRAKVSCAGVLDGDERRPPAVGGRPRGASRDVCRRGDR